MENRNSAVVQIVLYGNFKAFGENYKILIWARCDLRAHAHHFRFYDFEPDMEIYEISLIPLNMHVKKRLRVENQARKIAHTKISR